MTGQYKPDPDRTTISILKTTRTRISSFGKKCDSYDDILIKIMDAYEGKKSK